MVKYFILFILLFSGLVFSTKTTQPSNYGRNNEVYSWKDYTYLKALNSMCKFYKTEMTWHDAKRQCELEGASLFYPENVDEANAVISFWNLYQDHRANWKKWLFVGMTDLETQDVFVTIDGKHISEVYNNWAPGQPDNHLGVEHCVHMNLQAQFNDINCNDKFMFVCKKTPPSLQRNCSCNSQQFNSDEHDNQVSLWVDYTYIEAVESFYKFHKTEKNWHDAKRECELERASLFYAENVVEANAAISFWEPYLDHKAPDWKKWLFVGISDLETQGVFVTIDGKHISEVYNNWDPGQPDNHLGEEHCVNMYQKGQLNDINCDHKYSFICKKTPPSLQRNCSCNSEQFYSGVVLKTFVYWPNATVPFYINPDHFDHEQATAIMKSLTTFGFKTCIKFTPVMSAPSEGQHVMTFINPTGVRRCGIETKGHSNFDPHFILLGYKCLHTPELDMMIARALGLPFEHNRMDRDDFIDVRTQNIEPSYIQLFTKERILPSELLVLPYDYDSIMHFRERDFSKNGHKTIIFKKRNFRQNRNGLTATDVKKLSLIYEPECLKRDRAEKKAVCQSYPGVSRRKREIVEPPANMSLRVNPNITPPPHILTGAGIAKDTEKPQEIIADIDVSKDISESLNTLGVVRETDRIIELVYQLSTSALKNAREKYCNVTINTTSEFEFNYEKTENKTNASDVLGIHKIIAGFAKSIVDDAASNLTEFCQNSGTVEAFQSQCKSENDARCPKTYTSGALKVSSKHELIDKDPESVDVKKKTVLDEVVTTTLKPNRRKRETDRATTPTSIDEVKEKKAMKKIEMQDAGKKGYNLKEKVKAMKEERLKEIKKLTTKSEVASTTTDSKVKDDKRPTKRKFIEKRFIVQKSQASSDWESDISLNKQIEPQKTFNNKELLKKVLKLGAGSLFEAGKENKESVEQVNGVEKEAKTAESSAESANSNEDHETTEEEGDRAVTQSRKEPKTAEESSSEEVEPEEKEETPHNRDRHNNKRTQKRKIPKTVELNKLNKEFYTERKWPDGVVIYVIEKLPDYDLEDLRSRLATVNGILMEKTCVKLREVNAKEAPGFDDYLILDNSPDYVTGRVGGKQNFGSIELFEGGHHKQHTAMMVMAMLGFYFEVSRHDRDKYIRVHNRHIRADKLHHFEKIRDEATLDVPYDYKSATHPAWQFWRRVGKRGISTVATYKEQDPDGSVMRALGQNPELLSETDIIKINSVYGVKCFQSNHASSKKKSVRMLNEEDDVIQ